MRDRYKIGGQCEACPWRDMDMMRADYPEVVGHAEANPDGFVCHVRCGPCPGPRHAAHAVKVASR